MDVTSDGQKKVYGDAYDRNGRGCADECIVSQQCVVNRKVRTRVEQMIEKKERKFQI